MNLEGIPVFHKGAVISWGRSIGVPDAVALQFIQKAGAIIIDDSDPPESVQ
jgi:hypothetical protein